MSTIGAEKLPVDYVQQSIESQLDRLSSRVEQNKPQDRETLLIGEVAWIAYIESAVVGETVEDAIYFMNVGNVGTAYAIVWTDPAYAKIYSADKYKNKVNTLDVLYGFDLAEGTEWKLIKSDQDKLTAAELLEALPV